ncbi:MAG: hypothetical protein IJ786_02510 [Bacteroidaceae bacterium]|nr:hypothetical protein [Bacteroidaceae bacterium]
MKKILLLMSLVALPFVFTSCGDDNDGEGFVGKALSDPTLKAAADEYWGIVKGSNPGLGYDEVQLKITEDGFVEVRTVGSAESVQTRGLKAVANVETIEVFEATKDGENTYVLKGKGSFTVNPGTNKLTLNLGEGLVGDFVAEVIKSNLPLNDLSNKVFRTWNIIQTNIAVKGGDLKDTYSKNFQNANARNLEFIANDIDRNVSNVNMLENLGERATSIKDVTLSRTGSIIIRYENGLIDAGGIQGISDKGNNTGDVYVYWPNEFYSNEYLSGDLGVTATIESNCLRLAFTSEVEAEGVSKPYDVTVEFTMEWAN